MTEKIVPKKINEYSYLVEKHGKMNVPVKIFADEKLMDKMMKDNCLQQGINVACLPGIKGFSVMMPDAHQGYGFSIGGVAAIDCEDGCISPGGIGYDIGCLTTGSRILSEHGYYKEIQDFEFDFIEIENAHKDYTLKTIKLMHSLVSFDNKSFSSQQAKYFMKKKHFGQIFEIKTKLGYTINVSEEHPILTKEGMVEAQNLSNEDMIAVYPFEGVEYEGSKDTILVDESRFTKQEKDELNKRGLLPLTLNHHKLPIITKLFGYLIGDGSIYFSGEKGFVNAYGSEEDLKEIQRDLSELGFSAKIYSRERDHRIWTKYSMKEFTNRTYELHTSSNALARLFFELGYPQGNKTITPYTVPRWIMDSPIWIKRLFLSGLFGAELSSPQDNERTTFSCPILSMNKNRPIIESGREFCIQLMALLEEFEVETLELCHRKDYFNKYGPTDRLKLAMNSEENNLLRLWSKIGFSYNKKRSMLSHIAIMYIKEKQLLRDKRVQVAAKVKDLKKKGLKLREIQKLLASNITNERFIERHYYQKAGQRIFLGFPSFKEYAAIKQKELEEYGCFFDKLDSITKKMYDGWVYDFNIPKTHSFIADNIIVSNCGVRLLQTNLNKEDVYPNIQKLLDVIFKNVPPGVGAKSIFRLDDKELDEVMNDGVKWALKKGYGTKEDQENCEDNGTIEGADPAKVTRKAKERGRGQLGTLGSGNHFIEVQYVNKIYNKEVAEKFGIKKEGQVVVMIHCGSRGLGHQNCSDYLRLMEDSYPEIVASLPEKELIYAPAKSKLAQDYFKSMCAAANFAFVNRHMIGHQTRKSFKEVFGEDVEVHTVYDVHHNIAKLEEHTIDGEKCKLWVHRKGATRAFGPETPGLRGKFKEVGQPILIPGSMGTSSWVLVGTNKSLDESFGSTAHGAGRAMSRKQANQTWRGEQLKKDLEKEKIYIKAASWRGISEEAPQAYKDVDEVIEVSDQAGIGNKVAQLKPIGVVKG